MVLTEKGFLRPTYDELLDRQEQRAKKLFGEDIDTSSESILGKYLRINVDDLAECYELLEDIYYARFPDSARGQSLDRLCVFAGIVRNPATASKLQVCFYGNAGAVIPMGFLVTGDGMDFYVTEDCTVGAGGSVETGAVCTETGTSGNIDGSVRLEIKNPTADLDSVKLVEIREPGSAQESDTSLRRRFRKSVAGAGSGTINAIRSALFRVPLVEEVAILENDTEETVDGRPPGSFECYVCAPESQEQLIAEAIFSKKPLGIKTVGTIVKQVLDKGNKPHEIRFSKAAQKMICMKVLVYTNQYFEGTGKTQIQDSLMDYVNNLEIGQTVYFSSLFGYIHQVNGVVEVRELSVSEDGTQFGMKNIEMEEYEIARLSEENIVIEVV